MATPAQIGSDSGSVPNDQQQQVDAKHDGAPAGLTFSESELPSVSVPGGTPMTLGGYSPDPSRTPQVSTLDDPRDLGVGKPPSGVRR